MLIWMREGAGAGVVKFVLLGMLLMAVAGLVLMDAGGFFRNTVSGGHTLVKGGDVDISLQHFDRTVRRALNSQGMNAQEAMKLGLINKILESEIQNTLFSAQARKLGLVVSDEAVKAQISKLAEPLVTDGRSKKDALQQVLRSQGISEGEFVQAIRQEMGNGLLKGALQAPPTLASPLLAANLYRYDNEKRSVKVIVLTNDSITGTTAPTEDALKKYYDANKMDFLIPETRTITLATLKSDMVQKNVTISDDAVRAEYDKNIASYTKPSVRVVEQSVSASEADAKKAVESIKSGKSLKDSVGADAYLGEKEYEQASLLPELSKPAFDAAENTPVGPIKTNLGWHVLVVKKIIPAQPTPFDQVKGRLKTELEQAAMTDEMYQVGNTIEDRIAGGDKLADLVTEYGMTTEIIGPFYRNGMSAAGKDLFKPYMADRQKLIDAAFDYDEGEMSNLVETADGQFHVVHIDQVMPDNYTDFKTVKPTLEKRWMDEQKKLANKAKVKSVMASLDSGKSIEDAAKENNLSVRAIGNVNRKDAPAAPITPVVAAQIFTTDIGKNFSAEIDNGFVIGQVTGATLPEPPKADSKELKDLEDLVGRSLPQDILGQYIIHLGKGKKIQINQQLLEQTYAKPAAQ